MRHFTAHQEFNTVAKIAVHTSRTELAEAQHVKDIENTRARILQTIDSYLQTGTGKESKVLSALLPCDMRSEYAAVLRCIWNETGPRHVAELWSAYVGKLRYDWRLRRNIEAVYIVLLKVGIGWRQVRATSEGFSSV